MIKRKGKSPDEHYQEAHQKLLKAMEESVMMVEADAKLLSPVDTGRLRTSITHDVKDEGDKIVGECGTNCEYGFYASLHTPYLEPALDQNLEEIRRKIGDALK